MFDSKIIVVASLIVCAHSRHLCGEVSRPYLVVEDGANTAVYAIPMLEEPQIYAQDPISRVRRQAQGTVSTNSDGTNVGMKIPLTDNEKNTLSAIGSIGGIDEKGGFKSVGGGLAWDNVNGHGASLTGQHMPELGNQLTAAAKANLFHNDKHDVTANAFATRTFSNNANIPDFNTYGGSLGYTYNNKLGASLGMSHTDLFKKTDYSAMGNLNLFKDRSSSFDLNAGFSKSVSPYMPRSSWEPSAGISFTRYF